MNCSACLENLGPYVDGELPPDEAARIEEHLRTCTDCAQAHRRLVDTSSRLRAGLMRYEAPDVLKARIRASLTGATGEVPTTRRITQPTWSSRWSRTIAAAAVVALASSALTVALMQQRLSGTSVADQVLASHIRSLMPGHLTDVASNDQHNVKPWFNGRVNVSPDVPRLDSLGYPLVGGRLDYIEGHNVATVVYLRRQHVINVFSWPTDGAPDITSTILNSNGYHLIRARRNGVEVWIVSDVNLRELEDFARMVTLSH